MGASPSRLGNSTLLSWLQETWLRVPLSLPYPGLGCPKPQPQSPGSSLEPISPVLTLCPGPRPSQPGLQHDRRTGGFTSCASDLEIQGVLARRWRRTWGKTVESDDQAGHRELGGMGGTRRREQQHWVTGTGWHATGFRAAPTGMMDGLAQAPRAGVVPAVDPTLSAAPSPRILGPSGISQSLPCPMWQTPWALAGGGVWSGFLFYFPSPFLRGAD